MWRDAGEGRLAMKNVSHDLMLLLVLTIGVASAQADDIRLSVRPVLPSHLSHVTFAGSDGSTCQKAITVRNAANNREGVAAEKAWIAWKYPKAKVTEQAVSGAGKKTFDTLDIETLNGESKTVCFDITDFFGQW